MINDKVVPKNSSANCMVPTEGAGYNVNYLKLLCDYATLALQADKQDGYSLHDIGDIRFLGMTFPPAS